MRRLVFLVLGACGRIAFDARSDAGATDDAATDVSVDAMSEVARGCGFSELAGGGTMMCARTPDGTTYCWGINGDGQLGDGTNMQHFTPMPVAGVFRTLARSDQDTMCAIALDTTVQCWGKNDHGILGAAIGTSSSTPIMIEVASVPFDRALDIGVGEHHACARRDDRTVWCWGDNDRGQAANPIGPDVVEPTQVFDGGVPLLADELAVGHAQNCARIGGDVRCWGWNMWGQLGDTTTTTRPTLAAVQLQSGPLTNVVAMTSGYLQTCAVRADTSVVCWGTGIQVGNPANGGATSPRAVPVFSGASAMTGAASIGAGDDHSCALMIDGTVQCWGQNDLWQLGDTSQNNRAFGAPVQLAAGGVLTGARALTVGNEHSCALRDTDVQCWGGNDFGQLGTGGTATPVAAVAITCP